MPAQEFDVVTPQQIIAECEMQFEPFKSNCSGFVKAVAAKFNVILTGQADHIVDQIKQAGWSKLKDGVEAKAKADAGWLVVGGLKSADHKPPRSNGHVVIVVKGDLAHSKYPTGYWGSSGGSAEKNKTINYAWNTNDRDEVIYSAIEVSTNLNAGDEVLFMPAQLSQDVKATSDESGNIRQLSYSIPYKPSTTESDMVAFAAETPRSLAEKFLHDTAPVFGLASSELDNFSAFTEKKAAEVGVELRFKEEKKAVGTAVAIDYDQTIFGLPIWEAGVTVRIDANKMAVTGAHNARHYDIQAHRPSDNARYMPNLMHPETVASLLGVDDGVKDLTINATGALVYRYVPEDRYDSQIKSHENSGDVVGLEVSDFPNLPLPPVPGDIVPGTHYVVTEVLFTLPYKSWGRVNWRAFIEPDSGAVLYLRALISCARTAVFKTDPVSATGVLHGASSPVADLDQIRETMPLFGLKMPDLQDLTQQLEGEFVKLVNTESPPTVMPTQNSPYDFFYSCNTPDFAACNAYYHCDGFFRLLKGMGIDVNAYFNNTNFPVPVDPHARDGGVNAAAHGNVTSNGLGSLVFGVVKPGSNIGIAADARVVIHEFGHAVLWDHVNSPNFGFAHSPGDSLAAILHDPHSKVQGEERFETFPFMKHSGGPSRRHYRKVSDGWGWFGSRWNDQYGGEQVLSTTLFRVYRVAGGDSDDLAEREFAARYVSYLILKAVGLMSFKTPDPDVFVAALTEADSSTDLFEGHPGGAFGKIFRWSFEKQGLYQSTAGPTTKPGLPPDIDIYIEDGRNGEYEYTNDFTSKTEIWNRLAPDGQTTHQAPAVGVMNHAYVRIRNRGTKQAKGVAVSGFRSRIINPQTWPLDWEPLISPVITDPSIIKPGDSIVVGPFAWMPEIVNDSILFSASTAGDRSNIEIITGGPVLNKRLVLLDNNMGQRSF